MAVLVESVLITLTALEVRQDSLIVIMIIQWQFMTVDTINKLELDVQVCNNSLC